MSFTFTVSVYLDGDAQKLYSEGRNNQGFELWVMRNVKKDRIFIQLVSQQKLHLKAVVIRFISGRFISVKKDLLEDS